MFLPGSFEKTWIQQVSKTVGKHGDPMLVEKIMYAFALLEQLKLSGLDMIFKGGTCLFLMSYPPSRFSIDVDIIVPGSPEDMPPHFDKIIKSGLFLNWHEDNVRKSATEAPIGHYKFYYKSITGSHFGDEPILLDVLFSSKSGYKRTFTIPVRHNWLLTDEPYELITVPSFESVLGDKLTAFAPNTTGILYSKNRPVEIIKQLFDIEYLFDKVEDIQEVKESFIECGAEEIAYRNLTISYEDVLQDAFETALLLTKRDFTSENFKFLQKGISNIVNFIITPFKIEDAIICASKVAYLTQAIKQGTISEIPRFKTPNDLAALTIAQNEYTKLNRLKNTLPEAFIYWYNAINLL